MIQIFGQEKPNQQWILTDYDVWAKNPYYVGPDQPHPEDDYEDMKPTKNLLHFSKSYPVSKEDAKKLNIDTDSGNGYYSYDYYVLPFSGEITQEGSKNITNILHKRHYRYPFTTLKGWERFSENEILVGVAYHHGD